MLAGAAIVVSLVGAILATSAGTRHRVANLLNSVGDDAVAAVPTPAPKPLFSKLVYDAPTRFSDELVRGDLLAFSPGKGLVAAADGSGAVVLVGKDGKVGDAKLGAVSQPTVVTENPIAREYLATDPDGDIYVSSTKSRTVEKRGADGAVLATIKGFDHPEAIAVDDVGNVFVVDTNLIKIAHAHMPDPANVKPVPPTASGAKASPSKPVAPRASATASPKSKSGD